MRGWSIPRKTRHQQSTIDMYPKKNALPSLFLVATFVSSCTQAKDFMNEPRLQGFDLDNEGVAQVQDVEIRYGEYVFPPGGASSVVRVPKIKGLGFHQSATVPIPATARIHWKAADGRQYDVTVPIRNLISNLEEFHRIKFIFVDDHVDLAVIYARQPPQPYGTFYVRAYSSGGGELPESR